MSLPEDSATLSLNSSDILFSVSPAAAQAYYDTSDRLVAWVRDELEANADLPALIGGNQWELMRDGLKNHAAFLTTALRLSSSELLVKVVPWMYRVYRARGFSYDYFPIEFATWKKGLNECLSGSHAVEICKVYDQLITIHLDIILRSESSQGLIFAPQKGTNRLQEGLLSSLLSGDTGGTLRLVDQAIRTKDDLKCFYLNVLAPVMYRIGILWERNEISVAEEHLSTAIVGRIAATLYARFATAEVHRGKAVVSAGCNELHEVGARVLADFLELEGWDVHYLGANTPCGDLIKTLNQQKPFLVALSVSTLFNLEHVRKAITAIKEDQDTCGVKIMVGGLAFNVTAESWRDFGADGYAVDAEKAALCANTWWDERDM